MDPGAKLSRPTATGVSRPSAAGVSRRIAAGVSRRTATGAALAAIIALAAVLRFAGFALVPGNPFYDAAVRSMTQSWHNFFFGAYEPGAQVSIDKIPLDLWLQVASVKILGFTGTATRLPEAIAGVLAVPLLYSLVRRLYGPGAGLAAAAALAVLPAAVLTAHSDTMDSLMMLLDVLAAWLVVRGALERRPWLLVAAGAVMGVAFNVKLFEGLLIAPALVVLALWLGDLERGRRARALAGAAVAFVAVSLSWLTAASLAPGAHPWPIGSTNGSVWNVVFVFNGSARLSAPASPRVAQLDPAGPARLFTAHLHDYATLVGSSLLAAFVFGALALVVARRGRPARLARPAAAAFFGLWLLLGFALTSQMQRLQIRYLEAYTPAIAAVTGIGVASLARRAATLPAAVALGGGGLLVAAGGVALARPPAGALAVVLVAGVAAAVAAAVAVRRPGARTALAAGACALAAALALPAAGAVSVARNHTSGAGLPSTVPLSRQAAISRFLLAHDRGARYEVASPTVYRSSWLIARDGRPVLMLTGLYGSPLLTPRQLAREVAAGRVRYMLGLGLCASPRARHCAPVLVWARNHARDISSAAGVGPHGTLYEFTAGSAH
jgi:4-amino-4-deoxy-L-arabinose transferase-like glycosyltransferase